jgi:hypothetical protein
MRKAAVVAPVAALKVGKTFADILAETVALQHRAAILTEVNSFLLKYVDSDADPAELTMTAPGCPVLDVPQETFLLIAEEMRHSASDALGKIKSLQSLEVV